MIEIKEKFMKVFGIEPIEKPMFGDIECDECIHKDCDNCGWAIYPEITDRILLEMICICNSTYINGYTNYFTTTGKTKEELEEEILKKCITLSENIKSEIQQLFKGEE